jgi:tetratricopeptide (TPR) repeat protein
MPRLGAPHLWAVLLGLTVVPYLPLWHNGYVDFDDELYITANPEVTRGLTGPGFRWAWTNHLGKYWMPLSWLSLQLDAQLFSPRWAPEGQRLPRPAAVHFENLCWHAASVLLLFGLWRRLTGARGRSFLVAALFAVHPMHVESVAWAAERKDVLSTFFGVVALWAYLRYREKPSGRRYLGVAAAFLLSLLAKPMLVTLPFVLLLLDYWPLGRPKSEIRNPKSETISKTEIPNPKLRGTRVSDFGIRVWGLFGISDFGFRVLEKLPLFALAAGVGAVTLLTLGQSDAVVSLDVLPLPDRLANALSAYGWYLGRTFWPWPLAALYPHPYGHWSLPSALAGGGAVLAVTLLAVWQRRRRPWLLVGWLWFVGTLVPVLGLTQSGEQAWADRFSYWPHIGLFVALAWGLGELAQRLRLPARAGAAAGALALVGLGVLTWAQVGCWRSTAALWERALAVTRDNDVAHLHLAYFHLQRGRLDQAEAHFAEAARIRPDSANYHSFLGSVLLARGKVAEAAVHFQETVARAPHDSGAWYNLGLVRLRQGRPAEAADCFRRVVEESPESADALTGLGLALGGEGKRQEAAATFRAALRLNPRQAEAWQGLGSAYLAQGRPEEATEALEKALQSNPRLAQASSDLGVALGRRGRWGPAANAHLAAVRLQDQGGGVPEGAAGLAGAGAVPEAVTFRCRLAFALNRLGNRPAADQAYRAAFQRDPDWPGKFTARAWRLISDPDPDARDPRLAYELATQAVEAVADPTASLLDARAAAEAALGRFPEAVRTARQALKKASAAGDRRLAASIRDHLRLYETGEGPGERGRVSAPSLPSGR